MKRSERGSNLVEFALVTFFILVPLLAGISDVGRVFYTYITLTNATREGAREGARRPWISSAIIDRTDDELENAGITSNYSIAIECQRWSASGNGAAVACKDTAGGDYITVSITYTGYQSLFGAITGVDSITLSGRTRMAIQGFKAPTTPTP